MWRNERHNLESLGLKGSYRIEEIPSIPIDTLPEYLEKTHEIVSEGKVRARFQQEKALAHGSYGNLFLTVRETQTALLKQPRLAEMNLLQEAVLQFLAQKIAEEEGIGWCIPKVYDIFWRNQKIWFSMQYIPGKSIVEWFTGKHDQIDFDFFSLIAQVSLYLLCLETHLGLDHRDLKLDNLLIKQQPCEIQIKVKETLWTLHSPFTVVILDFGFACLGSNELRGIPVVNLGDGILPPMDPCPKEGRDLFQLLTSFLGHQVFTQKIADKTHKRIDEWLSVGKKSYGPMARRWSTENWTYLVASQRDFNLSKVFSCFSAYTPPNI